MRWIQLMKGPNCLSNLYFIRFFFLISDWIKVASCSGRNEIIDTTPFAMPDLLFFFFSISFLIFHRKQHIVFELMISSWLLAEQCHSKSFFFFIFRWFFKMIFLFQTKKNTKKASWGRTNRLNSFFVCLLFFFFFFFCC